MRGAVKHRFLQLRDVDRESIYSQTNKISYQNGCRALAFSAKLSHRRARFITRSHVQVRGTAISRDLRVSLDMSCFKHFRSVNVHRWTSNLQDMLWVRSMLWRCNLSQCWSEIGICNVQFEHPGFGISGLGALKIPLFTELPHHVNHVAHGPCMHAWAHVMGLQHSCGNEASEPITVLKVQTIHLSDSGLLNFQPPFHARMDALQLLPHAFANEQYGILRNWFASPLRRISSSILLQKLHCTPSLKGFNFTSDRRGAVTQLRGLLPATWI